MFHCRLHRRGFTVVLTFTTCCVSKKGYRYPGPSAAEIGLATSASRRRWRKLRLRFINSRKDRVGERKMGESEGKIGKPEGEGLGNEISWVVCRESTVWKGSYHDEEDGRTQGSRLESERWVNWKAKDSAMEIADWCGVNRQYAGQLPWWIRWKDMTEMSGREGWVGERSVAVDFNSRVRENSLPHQSVSQPSIPGHTTTHTLNSLVREHP